MKIKFTNGGFAQSFHAIFDGDHQLTHWDKRKDNTLASFWRSNQGKKLRRETRENRVASSRRFTVHTKFFTTPPRQPVAA